MLIPVWVGAGAPVSAAGADITPPLPAGWQQEDLFVLVTQHANQVPASPPSGWTFFFSQFTGTAGDPGAVGITGYYRRAVSADTDPTVTYSADHILGIIFALRGVALTGSPINGAAGNVDAASNTALGTSGVIAAEDDCLILTVAGHAVDTAAANYSGEACAGVTNLTERLDVSTTAGVGGGIGVWTGERAVAGTVVALTATLASASADAHQTMAVRPQRALQVPGAPRPTFGPF
jgi:hypothetical protein